VESALPGMPMEIARSIVNYTARLLNAKNCMKRIEKFLGKIGDVKIVENSYGEIIYKENRR
jgi:hypothetical protein